MRCDIKQYWDLTDGDLHAVYDHAVREKILDRVFYDATLSRKMFPLFVRQTECFCALRSERSPAGFFSLSRFEGATARLRLGLSGRDRSDQAVEALDWCFSTFEFKSLLLVCPASDSEAAELCLGLGAARLAEIPGLCWLEKKKKSVAGTLFMFNRLAEPTR